MDELVLDGNAAAGLLAEVFGTDVSADPGRCAHCSTVSIVATLRAYVHGPGVTLRCPACSGVVVRIARTPRGTYVDLRGVAGLRLRPPE